MNLDCKVCYCFHITRRKLENFIRLNKPRVASQLSQCGGAGTGCGWCIPFLRQLHQSAGRAAAPGNQEVQNLDGLTAEEYGRQRAEYIRAGKGKPPPGAVPLEDG